MFELFELLTASLFAAPPQLLVFLLLQRLKPTNTRVGSCNMTVCSCPRCSGAVQVSVLCGDVWDSAARVQTRLQDHHQRRQTERLGVCESLRVLVCVDVSQ